MESQLFGRRYGGNAAENYERYFVPAIGAPVAEDLIEAAELQPNERVLDVACGTGVVTRMASRLVGEGGSVAGLDVNSGMLAVASAATADNLKIEWTDASAEDMPFPDKDFDVVLCQMGLQFIPDKAAALSEMRRVLVHEGRLIINLPGPIPKAFRILAGALENHIGPRAAGFVHQVFSLYKVDQIVDLISDADMSEVSVDRQDKQLRLPSPKEFLWQFVQSTPLSQLVAEANEEALAALQQSVISKWQPLAKDDALEVSVPIVTATARRR